MSRVSFLLTFFILLTAGKAYAGFDINNDTYANRGQGNSKTAEYDNATSSTTVITTEERRELSRLMRRPINNTGYFRLGADIGKNKINTIKPYNGITYPVHQPSLSTGTNTWNFDAALGYKKNRWRDELQWIHYKNMPYNPIPVYDAGPIYILYSNVTTNTFMFNFLRDFEFLPYFFPFMGGGVGVGVVSTNATLTDEFGNPIDVTSKKHYNFDPVANAQLGVRLRLFDFLWLDAGYRYVYMLRAAHWNFQNSGDFSVVSLRGGVYQSSGLTVGVSYQF